MKTKPPYETNQLPIRRLSNSTFTHTHTHGLFWLDWTETLWGTLPKRREVSSGSMRIPKEKLRPVGQIYEWRWKKVFKQIWNKQIVFLTNFGNWRVKLCNLKLEHVLREWRVDDTLNLPNGTIASSAIYLSPGHDLSIIRRSFEFPQCAQKIFKNCKFLRRNKTVPISL